VIKLTVHCLINATQYWENKKLIELIRPNIKDTIGYVSKEHGDCVDVNYSLEFEDVASSVWENLRHLRQVSKATGVPLTWDQWELWRAKQELKDILHQLEAIGRPSKWKRFKQWVSILSPNLGDRIMSMVLVPKEQRHQFVRISSLTAPYEGKCSKCGKISSSILDGLEECPTITEKTNENISQS